MMSIPPMTVVLNNRIIQATIHFPGIATIA